jgi:O-antigen ligase
MVFSATWFLVGALAGCTFLVAQLFRPRAMVLALAAILFIYLIGLPIDFYGRPVQQWINPLQANRTSIIVGLVPIILLGGWFILPPSVNQSTPKPIFFLVALYFYIGAVRIIHNGLIDGILTVLLAMFTLATIVVVFQRLSNDWDDFLIFPRVIVIAVAAFLAASAFQFVINPDKILIGITDRFIGVAANPQFAAVLCGIGLIVMIWLAMYDRRRFLWIYVGMAILTGMALLATGSRTGVLMFILGLSVLGIRRFGRQLLLIPLLGIGLMLMIQLAGAIGIDLPLDRFLAGSDTRTFAWRELLSMAQSSPWIGVGVAGAGMSENSILYAAASYGILAPLLLIGLGIGCLSLGISLFRRTQPYPILHPQADLVNAIFAAYFAGAVFEGYMIGRVTSMLIVITLTIVCGQLLLDRLTVWESEEMIPEPDLTVEADTLTV